MQKITSVSVFESESPAEVNLIKSKLEKEHIKTSIQNKYMSFLSTPTAVTLQVKVNLEDEKKAFAIIDAYLKELDLENN